MSTSVFASVGVQSCLYAGNVVHQVVDVLLLHKVKQPGLTHKYHVFLNAVIGPLEVPNVFAVKVYCKYVGFALCQQNGDTF